VSRRPSPTAQAVAELQRLPRFSPLPPPRIIEGDPMFELLQQGMERGAVKRIDAEVDLGGRIYTVRVARVAGEFNVRIYDEHQSRIADHTSASLRNSLANAVQAAL
jgi:hypothetical protein